MRNILDGMRIRILFVLCLVKLTLRKNNFFWQVMFHLDVCKILAAKHILKRWTKDARDVLHENHFMLRMGDADVESYAIPMEKLGELSSTLQPVSSVKDGM